MPRVLPGRPRGRHRRPKTAHLPLAVGSLALAAAATGAMGIGSPTATASPALEPGGSTSVDLLAGEPPSVLDPETVEAALALRSQETVERSNQRVQLGEAVAAAEAEQAMADRAALDQVAGDRLTRFAEAPPVWVVPVQGYRLTSTYGPRWGRMHTGLDLAAPTGTPIYAMSEGVVVSAEYEGGYGNKTVIRHPDGTETWYCHQSAYELRSGSVSAGQVIGYVGSTGNSTGPHLHLEVHPGGGEPINPLSWIRETLGLTI